MTKFKERVWKKPETFHGYIHEKTILANYLDMDQDEILSNIIVGIPDTQLRDISRLQGFKTSESLLQAFEEIFLSDRSQTNSIAKGDSKGDSWKRKYNKSASVKMIKTEKAHQVRKKTISRKNVVLIVVSSDHLSINCPKKSQGARRFSCGEHGHIAAKCPKK